MGARKTRKSKTDWPVLQNCDFAESTIFRSSPEMSNCERGRYLARPRGSDLYFQSVVSRTGSSSTNSVTVQLTRGLPRHSRLENGLAQAVEQIFPCSKMRDSVSSEPAVDSPSDVKDQKVWDREVRRLNARRAARVGGGS